MSMRTWRSWLVAACLVAAACSDDKNDVVPDAHVTPGPDGGTAPDGPAAATFAGEVIDLIVNKTADDSAPVAVDFASPDTEDPAVFDSLF
jgi:hypothetical protein